VASCILLCYMEEECKMVMCSLHEVYKMHTVGMCVCLYIYFETTDKFPLNLSGVH
jgi:hypothetical protein